MNRYDSIIVGAGHNGLVCAAYLAKAGQKVLVLEASAQAGGLAAVREFHPGFKSSVAHTISSFSSKVIEDLQLQSHGLNLSGPTLDTVGLGLDGQHVTIGDETVSGVSAQDAQSYADLRRQLKRFAKALAPFWMKTMPRIGNNSAGELMTFAQLGLKLRLLGKEDLLEFMRMATLPMRDLMDENFDNPLLKASLSWDGLAGSRLAPRSPNSPVFALLFKMFETSGGLHRIPSGGIRSLVSSLVPAATAAGAELRLNAPVQRITVLGDESGLRATGVELADGEIIEASRVISCADPKRTFLKLLGGANLEIEFANRIKRLRTEGLVAKLHLALSDEPKFTNLERADKRLIIAPTMDCIEFAFDDAKYGGCPEMPVMELMLPSIQDASVAPAGQHVLSANVMYVPANLKGGWTDDAKSQLLQGLIALLEKYAPGIADQVIHAELLTPHDLEQTHHVTGGHWHHTEFAVDQLLMMRPTYEAAQYGTPVPGLYLCGAGSHPGGGLVGAPGHNAAREILK
ncbi:MAG: NAD(P)/FAD-dependent oxidoreductase [Halioglobus sp.]